MSVETAPIDPNLPIRGRHVWMRLEMPARGFEVKPGGGNLQWAYLQREGDGLIAVAAPDGKGVEVTVRTLSNLPVAQTWEPLAYSIPEHIADPSDRQPGEELWVEVTLPKKGLPRPVKLGVKKDDRLTPLEAH